MKMQLGESNGPALVRGDGVRGKACRREACKRKRRSDKAPGSFHARGFKVAGELAGLRSLSLALATFEVPASHGLKHDQRMLDLIGVLDAPALLLILPASPNVPPNRGESFRRPDSRTHFSLPLFKAAWLEILMTILDIDRNRFTNWKL
jgi:hypothetical protein